MRVMLKILTPGMQQGDEADLGTQVLGSGGNRAQGLGGGVKQDVVDHGFILISISLNIFVLFVFFVDQMIFLG